MDFKSFGKTLLDATMQLLLTWLNFLLLPVNLWIKAVNRLAEQRKSGALKMENINSQWPFISYMRRFIGFFFDMLIVLSFVFGILAMPVAFIAGCVGDWGSFIDGVLAALGVLIGAYVAPIGCTLVKDIIQLLLLPFRKLISWLSKPAQQLDLNVNKECKEAPKAE